MMDKEIEILLVEDNAADAELATIALKKQKIKNKLKMARDGVEALEYLFGSVDSETLIRVDPLVVLLDLKLPRINGLEVLRRIKEHPVAKKIPVVILTSSSEEKDILESYQIGANSYIRKPVDFNQFAEAINQIGLYWLVLNKPSPLV